MSFSDSADVLSVASHIVLPFEDEAPENEAPEAEAPEDEAPEDEAQLLPPLPEALTALLHEVGDDVQKHVLQLALRSDIGVDSEVHLFMDHCFGDVPRGSLPPMAEAKLLKTSRPQALRRDLDAGAATYFLSRAWVLMFYMGNYYYPASSFGPPGFARQGRPFLGLAYVWVIYSFLPR